MLHLKNPFSAMAVACIALSYANFAAAVSTIWNGPPITFTKPAFGDWKLPENQDRITDNVWITRGDIRGIFNATVEGFPESNATSFGPTGTEWAFGTTGDIGSLTFQPWRDAVDNSPPGSVGRDMVLYLIDDDVFLDLRFTEWGRGSGTGGAFSYTRSTAPVPEPSTVALFAAVGLAGLAIRRRHAMVV